LKNNTINNVDGKRDALTGDTDMFQSRKTGYLPESIVKETINQTPH